VLHSFDTLQDAKPVISTDRLMTYNFTSKIVVLTSVPHLVLAWNFSHWKHSHWAYSSSEKHRAFSGIHEQRPASSVFEPELLFFTNSLFVVHFPALLSS